MSESTPDSSLCSQKSEIDRLIRDMKEVRNDNVEFKVGAKVFRILNYVMPMVVLAIVSIITYYTLSEIEKRVTPLQTQVSQLKPTVLSHIEMEVMRIDNRQDKFEKAVTTLTGQLAKLLDGSHKREVDDAVKIAKWEGTSAHIAEKIDSLVLSTNKSQEKYKLLACNVKELFLSISHLRDDSDKNKSKN